MWYWLFAAYTALVATLIGYAAHVALSAKDESHRADAYKVLKLIWTASSGTAGLVGVALKLQEIAPI